MTCPVVEIFQSIDGEGIRSGELAQFIRLAGCNLSCSYCDTRYAWDAASERINITRMTAFEIIAALRPDLPNVTVTGGEPLLSEAVLPLLENLTAAGFRLNIETSGAVDILPYRDIISGNSFFTVDYKLPSSGMEQRMLRSNYFNLRTADVVKFVVGDDADIPPMLRLISDMKQHCNTLPHIYVGVVWGKYEASRIVSLMLREPLLRDAVFQLQMHKFIWHPDRRGV